MCTYNTHTHSHDTHSYTHPFTRVDDLPTLSRIRSSRAGARIAAAAAGALRFVFGALRVCVYIMHGIYVRRDHAQCIVRFVCVRAVAVRSHRIDTLFGHSTFYFTAPAEIRPSMPSKA